jgi:hypothetical protein
MTNCFLLACKHSRALLYRIQSPPHCQASLAPSDFDCFPSHDGSAIARSIVDVRVKCHPISQRPQPRSVMPPKP